MSKERKMKKLLSVDELIGLNKFLCGSEQIEIRDRNILENIVQNYDSIDESSGYNTGLAAMILYSILREHPFVYNNRETAILATTTTMIMNGCSIHATDDELQNLARKIEICEISRDEAKNWIYNHYTVQSCEPGSINEPRVATEA